MGGVQTDNNRVNAKVEASLNLRFAESGTKKNCRRVGETEFGGTIYIPGINLRTILG